MKKIFLILFFILYFVSFSHAQDLKISELPDGSATLDTASVLIGNMGSLTGTTSRFTIAQLFGLDITFTGNIIYTSMVSFMGDGVSTKGETRYYDMDNSNYVGIIAPEEVFSTFSMTLPTSPPSINSVPFSCDTDGTCRFSTSFAGGVYGGFTPLRIIEADDAGNLTSADTDTTGTGAPVKATSPTLVTPVIGAATGTSLALTGNLTGLMPSVVITHASGVHDGSNNVAVMTDSGETFGTNTFVGMTLYNITDGSSCTITANTNTTITCTLAGGTDNDWDTSDAWQIGPGPSQSGSVFYVSLASTIRHPATAGYGACYYADGAVVLTVDMASASMVLTLDATALTAGYAIDSSGTTQDFICIHNKSATAAKTFGRRGTWVNGGAT